LVTHGEDHSGAIDDKSNGARPPWSLFCKAHSKGKIDLGAPVQVDSSKLIKPDHDGVVAPKSKHSWTKQQQGTGEVNARDRLNLSWQYEEEDQLYKAARAKAGVLCDVCDLHAADSEAASDILCCSTCGVYMHFDCYGGEEMTKDKKFKCQACEFVSANPDHMKATCDFCPLVGGALKPVYWRSMGKMTQKKAPNGKGKGKTRGRGKPPATKEVGGVGSEGSGGPSFPFSNGGAAHGSDDSSNEVAGLGENEVEEHAMQEDDTAAEGGSKKEEKKEEEKLPAPALPAQPVRQSGRAPVPKFKDGNDDSFWVPLTKEEKKEEKLARALQEQEKAKSKATVPESERVKTWWGHSSCGKWCKELFFDPDEAKICATNVAMATQPYKTKLNLIRPKEHCVLCGSADYMKSACHEPHCRRFMHVTCARLAGFEVSIESDDTDPLIDYHVLMCNLHQDSLFTLKNKVKMLVDYMDRQDITSANSTNKASKALYAASRVLSNLSWAWRWADWWITHGDNYEMPDEADKRPAFRRSQEVTSERMLRLADARSCRLAALSAALRERAYDKQKGLEFEVLEAGLRKVVKCSRLIGTLSAAQVDFVVMWCARAYRARIDSVIGIGDYKVKLDDSVVWCEVKDGVAENEVSQEGESEGEGGKEADRAAEASGTKKRKDELGSRSLPGMQTVLALVEGRVVEFESDKNDFDDFDLAAVAQA
jgi:hypothetical protein